MIDRPHRTCAHSAQRPIKVEASGGERDLNYHRNTSLAHTKKREEVDLSSPVSMKFHSGVQCCRWLRCRLLHTQQLTLLSLNTSLLSLLLLLVVMLLKTFSLSFTKVSSRRVVWLSLSPCESDSYNGRDDMLGIANNMFSPLEHDTWYEIIYIFSCCRNKSWTHIYSPIVWDGKMRVCAYEFSCRRERSLHCGAVSAVLCAQLEFKHRARPAISKLGGVFQGASRSEWRRNRCVLEIPNIDDVKRNDECNSNQFGFSLLLLLDLKSPYKDVYFLTFEACLSRFSTKPQSWMFWFSQVDGNINIERSSKTKL